MYQLDGHPFQKQHHEHPNRVSLDLTILSFQKSGFWKYKGRYPQLPLICKNPSKMYTEEKKGKTKIKMELQGTSRNYFLAIFKYFYFYMQLVLSCSLGLPLLTSRSNCLFLASNSFRACSLPPLPSPPAGKQGSGPHKTTVAWVLLAVCFGSLSSFLPVLFWNTI